MELNLYLLDFRAHSGFGPEPGLLPAYSFSFIFHYDVSHLSAFTRFVSVSFFIFFWFSTAS